VLKVKKMEIIEAKPQMGFRIFLKFNDGTAGVVDLSSFAGKGVFSKWLEFGFFDTVRVNTCGVLEWPCGLDLCPDALYMQLTGKSPEDLYSSISGNFAHA
jgi:hypothetical protein